MLLRFDVIITTYKRHESLKLLIKHILESSLLPEHIIIVDSSPEIDSEIQKMARVKYIRSSHGNQPYQRYLGYLTAKNEALIYFDDDMRILDKNALQIIMQQFTDKDIVGVQPNFINKNEFLDEAPKSKFSFLKKNKFIFNILKCFTGYCIPAKGRLSYCGIRGEKPEDLGFVECFNGGVFACKKDALYVNFNYRLFDLFEQKVGMGEDAILGFSVSQVGDIVYLKEGLFLHDDQKDSTYTVDLTSYGYRVIYSRLYLSLEYVRLIDKSKTFALIHYQWYVFWRLLGLRLNQILSYRKSREKLILGYEKGYKNAKLDYKDFVTNNKEYWVKEAYNDIHS